MPANPTSFTPGSTSPSPTAALDSNQSYYQTTGFTYPIDLGGIDKSHFISFFINESNNTQYTSNYASAGTLAQAQNPLAVTLGKFNPDSTVNQNVASGADGNNTILQSTTRISTVISLYMPPQIHTDYAADWASADLGTTGAVAGDAARGMSGHSSWADTLKSVLGDAIQNGAKRLAQKASAFTDKLLQDPNGAGQNTLSLGLRVALNKHAEVLFNGITFRGFQFQFDFIPRSPQEATTVYNIIQAFKFYSSSELNTSALGKYWIYPGTFDIMFYSNGQENQFINKISTCACTKVGVSYSDGNMWSALRWDGTSNTINGVPTMSRLSLEFVELELIHKSLILNGF